MLRRDAFTEITRQRKPDEMRAKIELVCCVLVLISLQTGGQSHASPTPLPSVSFPGPAETLHPPKLTEPPMNEFPQQTQYHAGKSERSGDVTATSRTERTVESETSADAGHQHVWSSPKTTSHWTSAPTVTAPSPSAGADNLSSASTVVSSAPQRSTVHSNLPEDESVSTFSSPTVPRVQEPGATPPASAMQPQSAVTTHKSVPSQTSASGWARVGPTHQEFPSKLNIGDDDLKSSHHRSSSPMDPLLAGLLSVFIVTTAVAFTVLFFRFRQKANRPEFHRLQDLPMDDLMEDTPLSRYTH